jgi:hypothetical protein
MQPRYLPFLIATCATLAVSLCTAWYASDATAGCWTDMPLGKAGLTAEYCEYNRMDAFIRQPVNAWSNLAYFFLGAWMLAVGIRDAAAKSGMNPLQRFPLMTIWLGLMLIGLCGGSFFFHASVTRAGQRWDMTFTYAVALSLIAGAGYRWALMLGQRESGQLRGVFLVAAVAAAVLMYAIKWRVEGKVALPSMMLIGIGLAVGLYCWRRRQFQVGWLLLGIAAIVLAAVCRGLDLAKVGCDPDGWLQLHAGWHLCTGWAAFSFWALLHGEKP